MWIVLREDLAMIRLRATSAHTFMSNAFMGKSRLDSPWPGAIYPCCCVAFGEEATAMTADQRQWLYLSP
jgi:hypothetical protein